MEVKQARVSAGLAGLVEAAKTIVIAGALAVGIHTFLFQPFYIPSGSMVPTLEIHDYLFVNKFCYGYSRFSMPFSPPLFRGRIPALSPKRGDVVVFAPTATGMRVGALTVTDSAANSPQTVALSGTGN